MALSDIELTHAAFDLWLGVQGEDNRAELERVKRILPMILEECCTVKQMYYIKLYFVEKKTMKEIAMLCGVNPSSVCRGIHCGLDRAYPYLKFCSPLFIKAPQKKEHLRTERVRYQK